jgi:hypothetical protein
MENDSVRPVAFDSQSIAAAMLRARNTHAVRAVLQIAERAQRKAARRAALEAANAVASNALAAQAAEDCADFGHLGDVCCARCGSVLRTEQPGLLLQVAELGRPHARKVSR